MLNCSPFENRHRLIGRLELGSTAQTTSSTEGLPARRSFVVLHTRLVFGGISLDYVLVEPHVRHGHSVLRQSASFVRADCRSAAKSFNSFQVFHQTILAGHALFTAKQIASSAFRSQMAL